MLCALILPSGQLPLLSASVNSVIISTIVMQHSQLGVLHCLLESILFATHHPAKKLLVQVSSSVVHQVISWLAKNPLLSALLIELGLFLSNLPVTVYTTRMHVHAFNKYCYSYLSDIHCY